jgi:hypothetical protein
MPQVEVKGCSFHITQAMFKNLKKIGMGPMYQKDKATREICREILSLNLMPFEKIEKRFNFIVEKVSKMSNNILLKTTITANTQLIGAASAWCGGAGSTRRKQAY